MGWDVLHDIWRDKTDFKPAPDGWQAAESEPNKHTGHWPGWLVVRPDLPENQYHAEGYYWLRSLFSDEFSPPAALDGTYELVGPKVQGNPYNLNNHELWKHGLDFRDSKSPINETPPRDFDGLKEWFSRNVCEGIVWHHPDGRMVKIKRRDFGLEW